MIPRYARPEMVAIWEPESRYGIWLEIETLAMEAMAEFGTIPKSAAVDLIIGPEGGWAVSEVAAAHDCGAILMSLGSRTLRADAVPIVALTALMTTWGELK